MKRGKMNLMLLAVLSLFCVIASQAGAQPFILSKVVDGNTPIPGGSGNFTSFSAPVISGGNVAFAADGIAQGGIYLFNGSILSKVADFSDPIPGGSGNFAGFSQPVVNNGNVVFGGGGVGQQGIYLASLQAQTASLSVPTMTEWGIVVMSVLFGASSIYFIRRKRAV